MEPETGTVVGFRWQPLLPVKTDAGSIGNVVDAGSIGNVVDAASVDRTIRASPICRRSLVLGHAGTAANCLGLANQ